MSLSEEFCLKNRMLFYNMLINLVGAWLIILLSFRSISPPFYEIADFAHRINLICIPVFYVSMLIIQLIYEQPIRKYIAYQFSNLFIDEYTRVTARYRLLNAPFFIVALDLMFWLIAAILYAFLYRQFTTIDLASYRVFFQNALVGLISSTAAFFALEQILQKSMVPYLFPDGGVYRTPNTARIRISTRLTAFIFAVNLIPFLAMLILVQGTYGAGLAASDLLEHLRSSVVTNSLISMSVGICLTILVVLNLSRPIIGIISVLKRIREGYFDGKVKVTTNDEIGYAGDVINEMTEGLQERERMKHSLALAKGVQLNLLPTRAPKIEGLDIAGISLYCDETGGDYYDYLSIRENDGEKVGIVVGDVSDHGVHSALLMTTARAFIRLRSSLSGNIADIVSDVNLHLSIDIGDGGQFMTMFFLLIDLEQGSLKWVRAGHDPAVIFNPMGDRIEELKGQGIPLGVDEAYQFQTNERNGLTKGEIIVLSTDGVWEARNGQGEIFGKDRFYKIIRNNAHLNAMALLNAVLGEIEDFQAGFKKEDDITMVVIKVLKDA